MTSSLRSNFWSRDCDSITSVTLLRTRDPPGVPVHLYAQPLTPNVMNSRCDVGYCENRQPRSKRLVGPSFSRILNKSVNPPNRRPNLYGLNSVKSATIIRPATNSARHTYLELGSTNDLRIRYWCLICPQSASTSSRIRSFSPSFNRTALLSFSQASNCVFADSGSVGATITSNSLIVLP